MTKTDLVSCAAPQDRPSLWKQVLDSLTAEIAVIDTDGIIIAVNDAWNQFAINNAGASEKLGIGANYLDVCRRSVGEDSILAERACRGIEQIFDGTQKEFRLEYPCHSPKEQRWFLLWASLLQSDDQRFVVTTHLSITERKVAEQRLVVAERLAAVGEAMRGLSHEGRNTLQRAQVSIDLLRFHVEDDREATKLLERIEHAQRRLLGLYEEVRDYAAPINLQFTPYSLDQLVGARRHRGRSRGGCRESSAAAAGRARNGHRQHDDH